MKSTYVIRFSLISLLVTSLFLAACAGKTKNRDTCGNEVDAAWNELSMAKTKGFSGSISYTKAVSRITAAKTAQTVEKFDACTRHAKIAREYIRSSYKGH